MFNESAQMSAPFELLVAVILMTFVILVGIQAMSLLEGEQCIGKTRTALDKFAQGIEAAVNENQINSISFSLPACFQSHNLTLKTRDDKTLCSHYCGGTKSLCKLFKFKYTRKGGENFLFKCVNIPVDTHFVSNDSRCQLPGPEWEHIEFEEGEDEETQILEGTYYFYPLTTGQLFPEVCVFKRQ